MNLGGLHGLVNLLKSHLNFIEDFIEDLEQTLLNAINAKND